MAEPTQCEGQTLDIYNYIKDKKIDTSKLSSTTIDGGWFYQEGDDYKLVKYLKSDGTKWHTIMIDITIKNPIIDCMCETTPCIVLVTRLGESNYEYNNIPINILNGAMDSLPLIGSGSGGSWFDKSTCFGTICIQNKYLTIGVGGILLLLLLKKK